MRNLPTCTHEKFAARVDVTRLTDEAGSITGYTADVHIHCADCGDRFRFIGMNPGASSAQPMVSADGFEARLPIGPAWAVPMPITGKENLND